MSNKPLNLHDLLRLALENQIDLGMGELVLNNRAIAHTHLLKALSGSRSRVVPAAEAVEAGRTLEMRKSREGQVTIPFFESSSYGSVSEHYEDIHECQKCSLGKTRIKFVYGVGNPDADLLFIGEAPGAEEDRQGEPFVGRAGQLLDKILAAIKLSRQDVYIANMLKCRPPGNRDPQPEEIAACSPHLSEQIRLIKPKLICMLGRIAAQGLLKTSTPLGKLRGRWHEYEGIPALVTYHPAALLRFPAYKKECWQDMQLLKARYDELTGSAE
jgi:uracil-DNA glycosylase family 4